MRLEELLSEEMERQRGKERKGEEIGRERGKIVQESDLSSPCLSYFVFLGLIFLFWVSILFVFPLSWLVYSRAKSFWIDSSWEEAPKIVLP